MTHRPSAMFQLYFASLIVYMGVSSQMLGSKMKSDSTVDLATVLNRVDQLEAGLHSTMSALQTTMDDLAATKTELQTTKTELETSKTELETTKAELALKTKNVAFSAHVNNYKHYASNLPVKFDAVDYNAGNGYNTTTGKFTAPIAGKYTFSSVLMVNGDLGDHYVEIIRSGLIMSGGYGHITKDYGVITIPTTTITHLGQGEQVWVISTRSGYLYETNHSSHFVGTLLSPD